MYLHRFSTLLHSRLSFNIEEYVWLTYKHSAMPPSYYILQPTTGLDSAGAYAVMESVRKLASKISVVCTIPQVGILTDDSVNHAIIHHAHAHDLALITICVIQQLLTNIYIHIHIYVYICIIPL
jgi:hypothetical protein